MTDEHERLLDRVTAQVDGLGRRITEEMRHGFDRVHGRIDDVQREQRKHGERIARIEGAEKSDRKSTSNQTVAIQAIKTFGSNPTTLRILAVVAIAAMIVWGVVEYAKAGVGG